MNRLVLLGLIASASFVIACSGSAASSDENTDDALHGHGEQSGDAHASAAADPQKAADDALAALIARAPASVSDAQADAVTVAAIGPTVTTNRLKLANVWAQSGDGSASRVSYALSIVYMGAPRDLAFTPSGQSFETPHHIGEDGTVDPLGLKVIGSATADYQLEFKVAGHAMSVAIPKGATAKKTATLIRAKIDSDKSKIQQTWGSTTAIGGGDSHGWDDWSTDVDGETVTVSISINS